MSISDLLIINSSIPLCNAKHAHQRSCFEKLCDFSIIAYTLNLSNKILSNKKGNRINMHTKGQLISKGLLISTKKPTKFF